MFNISKNKCVGCELCRNICPEIIELVDGVAVIKEQNEECLSKAVKVCPQRAIKEINQDLVFAIGTDDNEKIKSDDHVGMSNYFQIWRYSQGELSFQEKRENVKYKEDETRIHGDPGKAEATASALKGVDVLVGKMMGPNIVRLSSKFVPVITREPEIKKSVEMIKTNINEIVEEYEKEERHGIILN